MLLHFEDWSAPMFLSQVEAKGLPHAGKIIKVFATEEDPRQVLDRPGLTVVEANVAPFENSDVFAYPGRGTYTGAQLEDDLGQSGLNELGICSVRGLFRFANTHGFCQAAMAAKRGDAWLVDHPMQDIDGIAKAIAMPDKTYGIHLDVFFPDSIGVLSTIVDLDDPAAVLEMMVYTRWRASQAMSTDQGS